MPDKKPFWASIPGMMTGAATVITALLGLYGVISSANNNSAPAGSSGTPASVSGSPSPSPSSTASGYPGQSPSSDPSIGFPQVTVTPESLEFGNMAMGRSSVQTVTLVNSGDADLIVDSAAVTGANADAYTIGLDTCSNGTFSKGAKCQIKVEFHPKTTGPYLATLEVAHNSQDTPTKVPLSGSGVLLQL